MRSATAVYKSKSNRLDLIADIYTQFYESFDSFVPNEIGVKLAYLFGAIAIGDQLAIHEDVGDDVWFHDQCHTLFPSGHGIWQYIEFIETEVPK